MAGWVRIRRPTASTAPAPSRAAKDTLTAATAFQPWPPERGAAMALLCLASTGGAACVSPSSSLRWRRRNRRCRKRRRCRRSIPGARGSLVTLEATDGSKEHRGDLEPFAVRCQRPGLLLRTTLDARRAEDARGPAMGGPLR